MTVAALLTAYVWFTLWTNGAPGWVTLVPAIPLLGWFLFRAWTLSATLSPDALVIRNVLFTEKVVVTDSTAVSRSSRRRTLRVIERRPPSSLPQANAGRGRHISPGESYLVTAIQFGAMAGASGRRCAADDAADLIAAAAGLPPLPPRKVEVSRARALLGSLAGLALFVAGFEVSPAGNPATSHFASLAGFVMKWVGFTAFMISIPAALDYLLHRNRAS